MSDQSGATDSKDSSEVTSNSQAPLAGIKVLDFSKLMPGPMCTQLLGDLGADIIKVEPLDGEPARLAVPRGKHSSEAFQQLNRHKRSLTLDLKNKESGRIVERLIEGVDIVVETFRPGVMDKLGFGYESAIFWNPKIVYCSLSSWGKDGPYKDMPGHDSNYLSYAGLLDQFGAKGGPPHLVNLQFSDIAGAYTAAVGILAAALSAKATGKGRHVDISMMDSTVGTAAIPFAYLAATGDAPKRGEDMLSGAIVNYNLYETKDGKFMALGAYEKKFWVTFCEQIGRTDLIAAHLKVGAKGEKAIAELRKIFLEKTASEWEAQFQNHEVCLTRVRDLKEATNDPQLKAREMFLKAEDPWEGEKDLIGCPIKMSDFHFEVKQTAPRLGEHTREILQEFGFSEQDIQYADSKDAIRILES